MSDDEAIFAENAWSSRAGGKMLLYNDRTLLAGTLNQDSVRKLLRQKKAWGALWSYDRNCGVEGPWYSLVCDIADYDIDKIKSGNTRKLIRRGLKRTQVRRIEADWLVENGYQTYVKASSRYELYDLWSEEKFRRLTGKLGRQPDYEMYGVFVDEKLVAYGVLFTREESVAFSIGKFDPEYSSACPMYALFHTVALEYLRERGFKEIVAGARPLLHETNIGEFCERMGWRKVYLRLDMYLIWPVRLALYLSRVFRKPLEWCLPRRHFAELEGLLLAQDIARMTKKPM